jgi:hypothetical protein
MTSDAILAELRGLPGAPETLRERVLALPEPQPRFSWTLPRIDVRRFLLVAAPAILALGVGSAVVHGLFADGTRTSQSLSYAQTVQRAEKSPQRPAHSRALAPGVSHAAAGGAAFGAKTAANPTALDALPPATTRLNKYEAWLRVRVAEDLLSKATTRAMQIARGYGGYVASVDMNTPGKSGSSSLVLRVPVTKVEDSPQAR